MPEREGGYKTIDLVALELGITEDEARALISVLGIQPMIFREDKRRRFYSPQDIQRMKDIVKKG